MQYQSAYQRRSRRSNSLSSLPFALNKPARAELAEDHNARDQRDTTRTPFSDQTFATPYKTPKEKRPIAGTAESAQTRRASRRSQDHTPSLRRFSLRIVNFEQENAWKSDRASIDGHSSSTSSKIARSQSSQQRKIVCAVRTALPSTKPTKVITLFLFAGGSYRFSVGTQATMCTKLPCPPVTDRYQLN